MHMPSFVAVCIQICLTQTFQPSTHSETSSYPLQTLMGIKNHESNGTSPQSLLLLSMSLPALINNLAISPSCSSFSWRDLEHSSKAVLSSCHQLNEGYLIHVFTKHSYMYCHVWTVRQKITLKCTDIINMFCKHCHWL